MKQLLIVMLCIAGSVKVLACDVCGGSGAMSGIGFLPNSDFHFVGLSYRARTFSTVHPKLFASETTVLGTNTFQTAEVFGRYAATNRIQLMAFVPIHSRNITDTEGTYQINGIGDASLLANYLLIKKKDMRWFVGSGVKLPTGNYDQETNGQVVPNLQAGTGSYDALFTSNFTYLKNQFGMNAEGNYTLTSANDKYYEYGNQLDATFTGFYKWKNGKVMYVPQVGLNYTHTAQDVSNTVYNTKAAYTEASQLLLPLGLDMYRGNMGLRLSYKIPLLSNMSEGYVTPRINCQAQLLYIINKK